MNEDGTTRRKPASTQGLSDIQDELMQLRRQHELVVNTISDGIHRLDADGKILFENPAAARLLGWAPGELLGQPARKIVHLSKSDSTSCDFAECPIEAAFRDGRARRVCGGVFQRKDGTGFPVDYAVNPLEDERGKVTGALVVFRDVTKAKELESQSLRTRRVKGIGKLAGVVAHDMSNALSPILMAVDLFKRKMSDPTDLELLGVVETSAQRCAEMARQMLSFAHGMEGQRVIIQPAQLLREIEKVAGETFPKSIVVATAAPAELPTLLGDPAELHQVLLNLCANARDSMPDGGALTLTATLAHIDGGFAAMHPHARPGHYIVIEVSDTGSGISPDIVERMFDPFLTTKKVAWDNGIGLSTALAIVKNHGGFILVESDPGHGSIFRIHLPLDPECATALTDKSVQTLSGV